MKMPKSVQDDNPIYHNPPLYVAKRVNGTNKERWTDLVKTSKREQSPIINLKYVQ